MSSEKPLTCAASDALAKRLRSIYHYLTETRFSAFEALFADRCSEILALDRAIRSDGAPFNEAQIAYLSSVAERIANLVSEEHESDERMSADIHALIDDLPSVPTESD